MPRHILATTIAAVLALLLALGLGLPAPQIAMASVFIVMQPHTAKVLAKSLHRLLGTLLGAVAVLAIGAVAGAAPAQLLAAIGAWVCACTLAASFGRDLRAYTAALAGYTAILVAIPAALRPEQIGHQALMRIAEVSLGIACASLVSLLERAFGRAGARGRAGAGAPPAAPALTHAAGTGCLARTILAASHPALAMSVTAALWLATGWPGGAIATLNATADAVLVALAPRPLQAALHMGAGTLLAVAIGLALWWLYPGLDGMTLRLAALLPALMLGAAFTGRPGWLGFGLGYSITTCIYGYPQSLTPGGGNHLDDAAGLVLSIAVLLATCALLRGAGQHAARNTWQDTATMRSCPVLSRERQ